MKLSWKYCYILILLYVGVFWSWIQYSALPFFSYWDELYALLFGIAVIKSIFEGGFKIKQDDIVVAVSLAGYCLCSFMGNLLNNYAPISSYLNDFFLNLKFFMSLYATSFILRNFDMQAYRKNISRHVEAITIVFVLLFIIDKIWGVFPVYEVRFGISSEQFIFGHPTFSAAALYFLLMMYIMFGDIKQKKGIVYIGILAMLIIATLRFKAIVAAGLFIVIYVLFELLKLIKFNVSIILLAGIIVFVVCYEQIYFYFLSPYATSMPRGAILSTSLKIAEEYFPFGTGFGTFGSYNSGVYYSPVYEMYGISHIGGMTKTDTVAISDNYWPMVLGQSGIIGLLCMLNIWRKLYLKVDQYRYISLPYYLAGMGCCIYIITSSTSESAIVNPVCIPLAFILGMMFVKRETNI